jgi:hypothetical protein
MKQFLATLIAITLIHSMPLQAGEAAVVFGSFSLILPDGYTDNPRRGIDSRVGDITIRGKQFKIPYDDFGWGRDERPVTKLSDFDKGVLDGLIYYERIQDDPIATCITAWYHPSDHARRHPIVSLDVLGVRGASFSIQLDSKTAVRDAVEVLRAIKVTKNNVSAP